MKLLIFCTIIALSKARVLDKSNCNGVVVNGINYEKEVLKTNLDKPYQLAIDYNTNTLYFSYTTLDDKYRSSFAIGYLNLKNNEFGNIKDIRGGFANAVDKKTHSVYFGGSDGLYKLDPETKAAITLNVTDKNIWQLFSKDGIYFTTYPLEEAYLYKDGTVSKVTETGDAKAMIIAVDNSNNIFYANDSGLFQYRRNDRQTIKMGNYVVNDFVNDSRGNLYFSTPTGIFAIDEKTKSITKMARVINIYGVAFESDGSIIYASDDSIIRLKSTGSECMIELNFV